MGGGATRQIVRVLVTFKGTNNDIGYNNSSSMGSRQF